MSPKRSPSWLPTLSALVALCCWASTGFCFCRTTTCDVSGGDCILDAYGCSIEGKRLSWPTSCLRVNVESGSRLRGITLEAVTEATRSALHTWTQAECGRSAPALAFEITEETTRATTIGASAVRFRDGDWPHHDLNTSVALTTLTIDKTTGQIRGADVELNSFAQPFHQGDSLSRYDLELVLVHELGHVLGLAHSSVGNARMAPAYLEPTPGLRWLSADDELAVCAAYPPTRTPACGKVGETWVFCETLEECRWVALLLLSGCWVVFGVLWRRHFRVWPPRSRSLRA